MSLPGHQQPLHKNYHFGQNVSLLMGLFCKMQRWCTASPSRGMCQADWIKLCILKVSWVQDSGSSLWHNYQQGQEGPQLCWTRKWSFRVAMRFPDVTKSLKRNCEAEQAELTLHVHGKSRHSSRALDFQVSPRLGVLHISLAGQPLRKWILRVRYKQSPKKTALDSPSGAFLSTFPSYQPALV